MQIGKPDQPPVSNKKFLKIANRETEHAPNFSSLAENELSTLNSRLLKGLDNLRSINFFANKISCITPGAFDSLPHLKSLNLLTNPVNCNCHMGWFSDWLRAKGFEHNGPRCATPSHLRAKPVHTLPLHSFRCDGRFHSNYSTFFRSSGAVLIVSGLS